MKQGSFDDAFAEHVAGMERSRHGTRLGRLVMTAAIVLVLLWAAKLLTLG